MLLFIVGIFFSFLVSAQVQNLDFENWEHPINTSIFSNKPNGWIKTDGILIDSTGNFYYPPSVYPHQNNYALYLSVWYNHTKDAAFQKAPFSERPNFLSGWYHYKQNTIWSGLSGALQNDTARISVFLTKFNPLTNVSDTIGSGVMEMGDSTDVYTGFLMEINYTSFETPDSIKIIIDPSLVKRYPNRPDYSTGETGLSSFLLIDNLSLINTSLGVNEMKLPQPTIYPNPATDFIHVGKMEKKVSVFRYFRKNSGIGC